MYSPTRITGKNIHMYMYTEETGFQILDKNTISNKIMNTYLQIRHFPLARQPSW